MRGMQRGTGARRGAAHVYLRCVVTMRRAATRGVYGGVPRMPILLRTRAYAYAVPRVPCACHYEFRRFSIRVCRFYFSLLLFADNEYALML